VYACAPRAPEEAADSEELFGRENMPVKAVAEFAENVGLEDEELAQILRKLGSAWWADIAEEDLRQHDVVIALDSSAADAVVAEFQRQDVELGASGRPLLLSDFCWLFERERAQLLEESCADGSGALFLEDRAHAAVDRCDFEQAFAPQAEKDAALDVPAWPTRPVGLAETDGNLGEWRRLHCALLKGCWGLTWYLMQCHKGGYANPLSKALDHFDAIRPSDRLPAEEDVDEREV